MNNDKFWRLIDHTRLLGEGHPETQRDKLVQELCRCSTEDLVFFAETYSKLIYQLYHWDIWNAIYLINGGCGDDSFFDFRDFLIAKGKLVYDRVLSDPESLLDDPLDDEGEWRFEELHFHSAAEEAFRIQQGDPENCDIELEFQIHHYAGRSGPQGTDIDVDDDESIRRRFPRIWAHLVALGIKP